MPYEFVDGKGAGIVHKLKEGGLRFAWNAKDPIDDPELIIDGSTKSKVRIVTDDSNISFLRIKSRRGKFESTGKTNYTARVHILKAESNSDSTVGIQNAIQQGYLCAPIDFKDVEYTAIAKVRGIKDKKESFTVKLHGAEHVADPKEKTLCFGANIGYTKRLPHKGQLYEQEMTHPEYEFFNVDLKGEHPNRKTKWILIKVISYVILNDGKPALYTEVYYSAKPFNDDGTINTNMDDLILYWIKVDSTPNAPIWGGKFETLRVDMIEGLDLAYLSCYEIVAPDGITPPPPTNKPPVIAGPNSYTFPPNTQQEILQSCSDPDGNVTNVLWTGLENLSAPTISPDGMHVAFNTGAEEKSFNLTITATDDKDAKTTKTIPVAIKIEAPPPPTCPEHEHFDEASGKCVCDTGFERNSTTGKCEPVVTPPPTDVDEFGTKMLHPVTGKKVEMQVGGDPAGNGQRYNCDHRFKDYMMIGYYKTGKGQVQIEMKTDGPHHGGHTANTATNTWTEPDLMLDKAQFRISSEHPHPDNHPSPNIPNAKTLNVSLAEKWIGYAVCAWQDGQFRHLQEWVDTDPFDANGKPKNNWILGVDVVDTGQICNIDGNNPDGAKRAIPPANGEVMEAEIRMHKTQANHQKPGGTDMKWCRVYELKTPVT